MTSRHLPRARHYRRYGFVLAAACALAAAILIFAGGGSGPTPQPAFAAAAVKVAEANPRLLVTAPGWSIKHAYGFEVDSGSTIFGNGAHHLTFDWCPARFYRSYLREREQRGKVLIVVRGTVADKREYKAIMNSLRRVSVDTWLSAMPPEVVKPSALDATVKQMLRGVPIPPNFDPSTLPDSSLVTDRYRLGNCRDRSRDLRLARGLGGRRTQP